ncbi:Mth938-like domain-containing protein [Salinarimonas soli]|uniref:Mth938-like domain-containing protein n=1 Tax=Salinarimonas soli TaxID=1638099 RepID=A0A5B2V9W8_9HYPH|nr:MTH938/NDUFAF3 family protein [Salinarimonas soli]KAA2235375.1 hypothetical protein F0L46_20405 [Salinarimonas soli]
MAESRLHDGYLPGRHQIDAYGNGGFRFADMSHRGSILVLPSGIRAWEATQPADITLRSLEPVLAEAAAIELLLVGVGKDLVRLSPGVVERLRGSGLRIEAMQTGAAARTLNVLLNENRRVAAALIAVE